LGEDVRFKNYRLSPKSAADFAFLLHGFHYLSAVAVAQKSFYTAFVAGGDSSYPHGAHSCNNCR
jgi:hypothetical protein